MTVAAIDCGTNSLRLLVADVDPVAGTVTDRVREQDVVRLGEGVDRTGAVSAEALDRALGVTRRYAERARGLGATALRFATTSAVRDAGNRAEVLAALGDAAGARAEVLTGAEEAELSFRGATAALAGRHPWPMLVCDLGGGSTELVLGGPKGVIEAHSMDIGSVRLHERHLTSDPPTAAEVAAASADVSAALDAAQKHVAFWPTATLVGVAGTVTTITAHVLDLDEYDSAAVDGAVLPVDPVLKACRELLLLSRARRGRLPYLHPGRVDVIGAGALIWSDLVVRVRAEVARKGGRLRSVVTSERDLLDGLALAAAAEPGRFTLR